MKLSEDPQTGVVNQAVFWGVNLLQDFKCLHPCKTNVTCDRSKIYIQYDMSGNKYTMGTPYLLILSYNGLKYCMLINGLMDKRKEDTYLRGCPGYCSVWPVSGVCSVQWWRMWVQCPVGCTQGWFFSALSGTVKTKWSNTIYLLSNCYY